MPDTLYALYPVFAADPTLRSVLANPEDRARAVTEIEELFASWKDTIEVRGTYSTVGFRADADLMLWLVGPTPDDVQRALVEFRGPRSAGSAT